ncbi:MAG: rnhA operon protein [Halorientalis sp.]
MPDETPDPEDVPTAGPDDVTDDGADGAAESAEVPQDVIDEVERLTRLARDAVDDKEAAAYRERRADLLAEYGFTARVREDDAHDTLVLYPEEWLDDGVVRMDAVEDLDRGIERSLGGPGDGEDWDAIARHNREIATAVAEEHGAVHGENAAALAEFMSNHYAKPIDSATDEEIEEFVTEYFERNAWPSEKQRDRIDRSVALTLDVAESFSEPRR